MSQLEVNLKAWETMLKKMPEKMRRKEIMKIIRNVSGPAEKAAKTEAAMIEARAWQEHRRINSGNLERSIGRIQGKSKDFLNIQVAPRAKSGFKGFHAHLVHFGTKNRNNKKGQNRGSMPANDFMRRAFDKSLNQVRADFERKIAKQTEKYFKE